ncbi:uncharacterized protein LY79DRAFT_698131 [Colletotrichum navitas]|uniref:Uncharacterized protein n=1 Tax=Colletotrichum navitas TaxID=681940 RepID=A0AAD8V0B9_9PEZI|nr:uncharacterized protein LY79DRAFT_698131 [Colletotrichum navitas]KAK1573076.1 hypothetical protein LY79DRAFT_698131 [Colletotrichum navitas]
MSDLGDPYGLATDSPILRPKLYSIKQRGKTTTIYVLKHWPERDIFYVHTSFTSPATSRNTPLKTLITSVQKAASIPAETNATNISAAASVTDSRRNDQGAGTEGSAYQSERSVRSACASTRVISDAYPNKGAKTPRKDEHSPKSVYRKAMKQLAVLEATVQPKTHRATIKSCLEDNLPPKMEFVLTLPVTPIQATLYDTFLESLRKEETGGGKILGAVNSFCKAGK